MGHLIITQTQSDFEPNSDSDKKKMAGIMNKIGETLHIGGGDKHKEEEKHRKEAEHHKAAEHHGEKKEGFMEKIKDKVTGQGDASKSDGHHDGHDGKKKDKKDKKDKKKKKDGHDSSSSDSD